MRPNLELRASEADLEEPIHRILKAAISSGSAGGERETAILFRKMRPRIFKHPSPGIMK